MSPSRYVSPDISEQISLDQFVEDLRRALPPIHRNVLVWFNGAQIAIDLEWNKKTGALEIIGLGNRSSIVQVWWQELSEDERKPVIHWLLKHIETCPVIYQNADGDIRKMRAHGIPVTVERHKDLNDTMLSHGVLHCEEEHSLEYLQAERGKLPPYAHLLDTHADVKNACDIVETLYVWESLVPELAADPLADRVYHEERLALLPYLIHDEERGIRVNAGLVYPLRDEYATRRDQGETLARAYTGDPLLKLSAPGQVKTRVYDVEGFPVQYHKRTEEPTLDKDALAQLRRLVFTEWDPDEEPTLDQAVKNIETGGNPLLEARYLYLGAQQTLSHYIDHCFTWDGDNIVGVRDRIYPETRQHVQTSGRHSIVNPAMQQLKGKVERMVHPDPGTVWLGWDWSNIEVWLLGVLSGDPLILEAKEKGWDTHTINFCDITGTPYPPLLTKKLHTDPSCAAWRAALDWKQTDDEDDIRRTFAKRYVFRLHYRGNPENAGDIPGAKALNFDAQRLVEASERYLGKHHWIVEWWKSIEYQVDKYGRVYDFGGMPRVLTSDYVNARYREACNHPMQGGVARIYNRVRLMIHRMLPWLEFMYGKHDSQWWQCPESRVDEAWTFIRAAVLQKWRINNMDVSFPASFKERRPE